MAAKESINHVFAFSLNVICISNYTIPFRYIMCHIRVIYNNGLSALGQTAKGRGER